MFVVCCVAIGLGCWFGSGAAINTPVNQGSDAGQIKPPKPESEDDFLPGTAPWENLRLPLYTVPQHYDLTLYPDFYEENSWFYGNVTIEVDILQNTQHLMVHIKQMNCTGKLFFKQLLYSRQEL